MPLVVAGGILILIALFYMQYVTNRPPYTSLDNYLSLRQSQLKATGPPVAVGRAKVRWMDARWYQWQLSDGKLKRELIKFDTHGQPFIEVKGEKAEKYKAL
jgi:hypothetical protein